MSALKAARTAQYPLVAEFTFNFDDTMLDTGGVSKDFGATNFASTTFDIANLPEGAIVTGGSVVVETAYTGVTGAATISLGDSGSATRYASGVDLKSAARTALTVTGYRVTENLRATVSVADSATAGKATVLVEYIISGRANEVVPN